LASQKLEFKNSEGINLKGILDLPSDQKAQNYAIFAHCFTCNKNLLAVKHISTALTSSGIAVLRFDFTGLGESDGDFADSNFSSNLTDLVDVANYLKENFKAPSLLVGHSLGGAAAIFAAANIGSIKAVATIGAPSDPSHVSHLFGENIQSINKDGYANVQLSGREFKIKKQFLDDINNQNMKNILRNYNKALLIMHSPQDNLVGVEHAANIYKAALHPKSFISLDDADHLLTNKADSLYAGQMIATWAKRYLDQNAETSLKSDYNTVVFNKDESFTSEIKTGDHRLVADEPESFGGNNFGPSPYELLNSALGACTAMTLRMYANRKKWALNTVKVHLNHNKDYAEDCDNCETNSSKIDVFDRIIEIDGDLTKEQKIKLMEIANKCPVHKTLHNKVEVRSKLK
jgi:uncharacterized OsmC-like protein/alpha/beta superfamily hydrolase